MGLLENIHCREDIVNLTPEQDKLLCDEIREFLIAHVSDSGGHLASNLGIVEVTVALHKVFSTDKDRLIFDVGHQCYVHKLLTGRMNRFDSLRSYGGLSGFPKPEESVHDAFTAGHASNSVSVALGMARARTKRGEDHNVVALLGDGALTGGLAYEGLNDAGASGEPLVIILNDNGMSIAKNVGGISKHLALLRLKPGYFKLKRRYRAFTAAVPGGKALYRLSHNIKAFLKRSLIGTTLFEEMGLTYIGPVDGHDLSQLTYLLRVAKNEKGPVLFHIITQKGKGYAPAEQSPQDYHGVGSFDPQIGLESDFNGRDFSDIFGSTLCTLAEKDDRICAVTAAMPTGTGLGVFAKKFPDRMFDVGIAEGHAVSMAAGMAKGGLIPVVAIYSTFLQRGFDMLLHDVALQNLHVVFAVDRAGLVGKDGPTHHGVFDVGYLRQIPGMTVLTPANEEELSQMLQVAALKLSGPVAIRYPRGSAPILPEFENSDKPELLFITYGTISAEAYGAAEILKNFGYEVSVLRLKQISPLLPDKILTAVSGCKCVVCVEDVAAQNCLGTEIGALLAQNAFHGLFMQFNLGNDFVTQGTVPELLKEKGLDAESIAKKISEATQLEK